MIFSVGAAIVVLGLLIFVHELGHFLFAKKMGVGVVRFSLGFGPGWGKKIGQTEYVISLIPLGGYVKMVGEEGGEEVRDPSISFSHQPKAKRAVIVAAGPGFNLLCAWLLFTIVFIAFGTTVPRPESIVGGVAPGFPADQAGLQKGDHILAVDGEAVQSWEDLSHFIRRSEGKTLILTIREGITEKIRDVAVTPRQREEKNIFGENVGTAYVIGIERAFVAEEVSPVTALGLGLQQTWLWTKLIITMIGKMIQGEVSARDVGGPILIAQVAGQQARMGWENLVRFMAVVSVNLGVLNLLPVPILDGGHLFFLLLELLLGRPLSLRHKEIAQQVGLFIILALMALVVYNDITRIVEG